jgi:hypothetical protein
VGTAAMAAAAGSASVAATGSDRAGQSGARNIGAPVQVLGDPGEGREMHLRAEAVELLETHDQQPPRVGVDPDGGAVYPYPVVHLDPLDAHLGGHDPATLGLVLIARTGGFRTSHCLESARTYSGRRSS